MEPAEAPSRNVLNCIHAWNSDISTTLANPHTARFLSGDSNGLIVLWALLYLPPGPEGEGAGRMADSYHFVEHPAGAAAGPGSEPPTPGLPETGLGTQESGGGNVSFRLDATPGGASMRRGTVTAPGTMSPGTPGVEGFLSPNDKRPSFRRTSTGSFMKTAMDPGGNTPTAYGAGFGVMMSPVAGGVARGKDGVNGTGESLVGSNRRVGQHRAKFTSTGTLLNEYSVYPHHRYEPIQLLPLLALSLSPGPERPEFISRARPHDDDAEHGIYGVDATPKSERLVDAHVIQAGCLLNLVCWQAIFAPFPSCPGAMGYSPLKRARSPSFPPSLLYPTGRVTMTTRESMSLASTARVSGPSANTAGY